MKSAFSFCVSPMEGKYIDLNDLMNGYTAHIDDSLGTVRSCTTAILSFI